MRSDTFFLQLCPQCKLWINTDCEYHTHFLFIIYCWNYKFRFRILLSWISSVFRTDREPLGLGIFIQNYPFFDSAFSLLKFCSISYTTAAPMDNPVYGSQGTSGMCVSINHCHQLWALGIVILIIFLKCRKEWCGKCSCCTIARGLSHTGQRSPCRQKCINSARLLHMWSGRVT